MKFGFFAAQFFRGLHHALHRPRLKLSFFVVPPPRGSWVELGRAVAAKKIDTVQPRRRVKRPFSKSAKSRSRRAELVTSGWPFAQLFST